MEKTDMQRIMRTILVGFMILMMTFNPAAAWHHWGGGYAGNYYGYCRSYPAYASGYCGSCGYGGYGYSRVVYSSEPYGYGGCGGGCGSYGDCGGGCGECGGGCSSCGGDCGGGCSSCGGGGSCESGSCGGGCSSCGSYESSGNAVIESSPNVYQESAPTPPAEVRSMPTPPATVNKPMQTAPAPTL